MLHHSLKGATLVSHWSLQLLIMVCSNMDFHSITIHYLEPGLTSHALKLKQSAKYCPGIYSLCLAWSAGIIPNGLLFYTRN